MSLKKRRSLVIIGLGIFFIFALRDLTVEAKRDFFLFKNLRKLDDDQKRDVLVGDLYGLVKQSRKTIPEKTSVLVITDNPNEGLLLSYYLYPRKLFMDLRTYALKEYPEATIKTAELIKQGNIKWVIFRTSGKQKLNKVIKIEELAEFLSQANNI